MSRQANSIAAWTCRRLSYSAAVGLQILNQSAVRSNTLCPTSLGPSASTVSWALCPPPPSSPSPMIPSVVSTSTMVRTNRPQCAPAACRSGASSGTVTVVARRSAMVSTVVEHGHVSSSGGSQEAPSAAGRARAPTAPRTPSRWASIRAISVSDRPIPAAACPGRSSTRAIILSCTKSSHRIARVGIKSVAENVPEDA